MINLCVYGVPPGHVYKGWREEEAGLLGNVVISKKILRTRKIMVMHSNEREECCLRNLVDRKRKRYDNAVDVVVRLHDPTDQVPNARHLRVQHTFSSMTSLEL